ncbi:hypothetical protein QJS10_CPA03g00942 [Acorus calamus]|uniref:Uncharacterized protein n=1 Tax=Acorus calamus TaxID=4465 RepID=A0AAV9F532_ACOCL|nr:hypothetical protein QJS10_CPA03g00942 [Acorus calamus]
MDWYTTLLLPPPGAAFLFKQRMTFRPMLISAPRWRRRRRDIIQFPVLKCHAQILETQVEDSVHSQINIKAEVICGDEPPKVSIDDLTEKIEKIKTILDSEGEEETSISAYDTAWVSMIEDVNGNDAPQFPKSLRWIVDHQLPDGSWGDRDYFLVYDRLVNTLACVVALKTWNICPKSYENGIRFLRQNIHALKEGEEQHMLAGFEMIFPTLIQRAHNLGLDLQLDCPAMEDIYIRRNLKRNKIPNELMHTVPTTLLYSLEGLDDLDWERLLALQWQEGSFFYSPASTAAAFMQTKNEGCLRYLENITKIFDGGAPCAYPVDLFKRLWAVDRFERLGISRYFELQIRECLEYVYRYWTETGIYAARYTNIADVDDSAMGFRLLRLHGYNISANVFQHFQKDGKFFCLPGEMNESITHMYNLYRASQIVFPGEKILHEAKMFTSKFLRDKQASNEFFDKWIITKDLCGEVEYALSFPWYASLPRIETRFYVEQYGGDDDVWLAKTIYRFPYVSNNLYLELAKSDFNRCQATHQLEWLDLQKWYAECKLDEYGVMKDELLKAFFIAASSIFEPERALERLSWAKTSFLVYVLTKYFKEQAINIKSRRQVFLDFVGSSLWPARNASGRYLVYALNKTIESLSLDVLAKHNRDIHHHLEESWKEWMIKWQLGEEHEGWESGEHGVELLIRTIELCAGRLIVPEIAPSKETPYDRLTYLTLSICNHIHQDMLKVKRDNDYNEVSTNGNLNELQMQELVQRVLDNSDDLNKDTKKTFLTIVKSFYYKAHCPSSTMDVHLSKVLFERVD